MAEPGEVREASKAEDIGDGLVQCDISGIITVKLEQEPVVKKGVSPCQLSTEIRRTSIQAQDLYEMDLRQCSVVLGGKGSDRPDWDAWQMSCPESGEGEEEG